MTIAITIACHPCKSTLDQQLFLDEVNDFNLEVRYPEYRSEFYKFCTQEFAESYFIRIKEFVSWLRSQILSLIHISEPTRLLSISYAVFCLKKKKKKQHKNNTGKSRHSKPNTTKNTILIL